MSQVLETMFDTVVVRKKACQEVSCNIFRGKKTDKISIIFQ